MEKVYFDYECTEFITEKDLLAWYNDNANDVCENSGACTFTEYINNCIDTGTLALVRDMSSDEIAAELDGYEWKMYKAYDSIGRFIDGVKYILPCASVKSILQFAVTFYGEIVENNIDDDIVDEFKL